MPLLWTAASYSLMGVVNPLLQARVNWPWFIVSQFVFGLSRPLPSSAPKKSSFRRPGGMQRKRKRCLKPASRSASPPSAGGLTALIMPVAVVTHRHRARGLRPLRRDGCPDRPVPADEIVDFNVLYAKNCSGCHGADGRLGPAPPLNDPLFLAIVPDDVLKSVVRDGRPGTLMPAFAQDKGGTLTAAQVHALANGLKLRWSPGQPKPAHSLPYAFAANTKSEDKTARIKRGAAAFDRACAGCHGEKGQGDSAGAIAEPNFLALISDQALRRIIITGRPDLGMPNFAGTDGRDDDFPPLKSGDINDLVAFLRHAGKESSTTAARLRPARSRLDARRSRSYSGRRIDSGETS